MNKPSRQLDSEKKLEISIVIPALNEEKTITEFVQWCFEGLKEAGVEGEVIIVDSSTDRTAQLAQEAGAKVICVPRQGLGKAYTNAMQHIRGDFVLMGDCDCTYDFRKLKPFVDKWREGNEFIMGSRFKGFIEKGAMPPLHRYFGTPLTTWIMNRIYSSSFSDIHCGMRGISLSAFKAMRLQSQSWEYASEMVLKAVQMELKITEVPVIFYKDRIGRLSHHKRQGWWSPWHAGWINLKAMFIYGANFFLFKPGIVFLITGLTLVLGLSTGPQSLGPITFSLYWMLFGLSLGLLGLQCIYMGILSQVFSDFKGESTQRWLNYFRYSRTVIGCAVGFLFGIFLGSFLIKQYVASGFRLWNSRPELCSYLAVTGLFFVLASFMTFTFTLLLHASSQFVKQGKGS